jgi:hypothetical protein
MPTAIDRQVEAFGRSVQEDQPDMGGDLQDLVHAGIMVARLIVQRSAEYRAVERPDPAKAAIAAERCRRLLGMMVQVQDQSLRLKEAGLELRHEDEFQDAVVELREAIAFLTGAAAGVPPPPDTPEEARVRYVDEFRRLAELYPPPRSWFEEDLTALRGPGGGRRG